MFYNMLFGGVQPLPLTMARMRAGSGQAVALVLSGCVGLGCAMKSAARTGEQAAALAPMAAVTHDAVTLCELKGLSQGVMRAEVCASVRRDRDKHAKAITLLATYGVQLAVLAKQDGPEGEALALAVLQTLEPEGLADYTELLGNSTSALVEVVSSGWARRKIRDNVATHADALLRVALAELVYARKALADAHKAEAEVRDTLALSQDDLAALDERALAERYGWPLGAELLRLKVAEHARKVAALEVQLYGFLLAMAHLQRWAVQGEGYTRDLDVEPRVHAAVACAAWPDRETAACAVHVLQLKHALEGQGLSLPAEPPMENL